MLYVDQFKAFPQGSCSQGCRALTTTAAGHRLSGLAHALPLHEVESKIDRYIYLGSGKL
jgi:hypothetical protein